MVEVVGMRWIRTKVYMYVNSLFYERKETHYNFSHSTNVTIIVDKSKKVYSPMQDRGPAPKGK